MQSAFAGARARTVGETRKLTTDSRRTMTPFQHPLARAVEGQTRGHGSEPEALGLESPGRRPAEGGETHNRPW